MSCISEDCQNLRHVLPNSGHELEQTPGDSEGRGVWHAAVHGVTKSQTRLCA